MAHQRTCPPGLVNLEGLLAQHRQQAGVKLVARVIEAVLGFLEVQLEGVARDAPELLQPLPGKDPEHLVAMPW